MRRVVFLSFFLLVPPFDPKKLAVQTNMVSYVVLAINIISDFRADLRGCLEATEASKPQLMRPAKIELAYDPNSNDHMMQGHDLNFEFPAATAEFRDIARHSHSTHLGSAAQSGFFSRGGK